MFGDGMFVFLCLEANENSVPSFLAQLKEQRQTRERPASAGREVWGGSDIQELYDGTILIAHWFENMMTGEVTQLKLK